MVGLRSPVALAEAGLIPIKSAKYLDAIHRLESRAAGIRDQDLVGGGIDASGDPDLVAVDGNIQRILQIGKSVCPTRRRR